MSRQREGKYKIKDTIVLKSCTKCSLKNYLGFSIKADNRRMQSGITFNAKSFVCRLIHNKIETNQTCNFNVFLREIKILLEFHILFYFFFFVKSNITC